MTKILLIAIASFTILAVAAFKTPNNLKFEISDLKFDASCLTPHDSRLTSDTIHFPDEKHLKNVQQLTFGGDNAEAYWSFDSKWITFQRTQAKDGLMCDQIFIGKIP